MSERSGMMFAAPGDCRSVQPLRSQVPSVENARQNVGALKVRLADQLSSTKNPAEAYKITNFLMLMHKLETKLHSLIKQKSAPDEVASEGEISSPSVRSRF